MQHKLRFNSIFSKVGNVKKYLVKRFLLISLKVPFRK